MCELGESPLKNKRAFIRPWRVRVVVLKSHDWIDVEGLGILTFKKDNIKKNYSEEFMAVYRDVNPNAQIQKNKEFIPKPKLDESVLLKLRQNYCMEEGECILYSKLEKRKIYTFVSDNFIEWRDKKIGLHIGRKINKDNLDASSMTRKQKFLLVQNQNLFNTFNITNLNYIAENIKKYPKYYSEISMASRSFIHQISLIFKTAEENEDLTTINILLDIVEYIIKSEVENVFNVLFDEENYESVFGILEYEGENQGRFKNFHRQKIEQIQNLSNELLIFDPVEVSKINLSKRLIYLADCVYPSYNEEKFFSLLLKKIHEKQEEIFSMVVYKPDILKLFSEKMNSNIVSSLKILNEMILILDASIDIERKKCFLALIKEMNFLYFITDMIAVVKNMEMADEETKTSYYIEIVRILKSLMIYDTPYFYHFLIDSQTKHEFIQELAHLFVFCGEIFQNEMIEIWSLLYDEYLFDEMAVIQETDPLYMFLNFLIFQEDYNKNFYLYLEALITLLNTIFKGFPYTMIKFIMNAKFINNLFENEFLKNNKFGSISLLKLLKDVILMNEELVNALCFGTQIKNWVFHQYNINKNKDNMHRSLLIMILELIIKRKNPDMYFFLDDNIVNGELFKKVLKKHFYEIEENPTNTLDRTINYTTPYTSASSFNNKDFLENEIKTEDKTMTDCFIDLDRPLILRESKMEEEKIIYDFKMLNEEKILFDENIILDEKIIINLNEEKIAHEEDIAFDDKHLDDEKTIQEIQLEFGENFGNEESTA